MRTKRRTLLVVLLVAALGGIAWLVLRSHEPEPMYQGVRLSVWLQQYDENQGLQSPEHDKAQRAIRDIGTNAIPTLLKMLQENDSRATTKIYELFDKQRFIGNPIVLASQRNDWGLSGFGILGAEAKNAVPALIDILENSDSPDMRGKAAYALGQIGPAAKQAVPALIRSVTATNRPANGMPASAFGYTNPEPAAVVALGRIRAEPTIVVPILLRSMADTNRVVSVTGIVALGDFGPDAENAIPDLLAEATNSTSPLRYFAMRALGKIHARPELVLPVLKDFLTNQAARIRMAAAYGLGSFGPAAKPALSNLLGLTKDNDEYVRAAALNALGPVNTN